MEVGQMWLTGFYYIFIVSPLYWCLNNVIKCPGSFMWDDRLNKRLWSKFHQIDTHLLLYHRLEHMFPDNKPTRSQECSTYSVLPMTLAMLTSRLSCVKLTANRTSVSQELLTLVAAGDADAAVNPAMLWRCLGMSGEDKFLDFLRWIVDSRLICSAGVWWNALTP